MLSSQNFSMRDTSSSIDPRIPPGSRSQSFFFGDSPDFAPFIGHAATEGHRAGLPGMQRVKKDLVPVVIGPHHFDPSRDHERDHFDKLAVVEDLFPCRKIVNAPNLPDLFPQVIVIELRKKVAQNVSNVIWVAVY
jgi:hypothetical protein